MKQMLRHTLMDEEKEGLTAEYHISHSSLILQHILRCENVPGILQNTEIPLTVNTTCTASARMHHALHAMPAAQIVVIELAHTQTGIQIAVLRRTICETRIRARWAANLRFQGERSGEGEKIIAWRRGGDSNPGHPFGVKLISSQPCSATPAPLREK